MKRHQQIEKFVLTRHVWTAIILGIFGCLAAVLLLGALAAGLKVYAKANPGLLTYEFFVALSALWFGGLILGRANRAFKSQMTPSFLGVIMWAIICWGFIFIDPHSYVEASDSFSWTTILSQSFRTFLPRDPQANLYTFIGLFSSLCATLLGVAFGNHYNAATLDELFPAINTEAKESKILHT